MTSSLKALGEFRQDRPARGCDDDMFGQPPAELFGDFEAMGLGALGVIGPQIDVDKGPAVFVADFAAESIDVIVVAFDGDGFWSVNGGADDLSLFQAVGDKNIAVQPSSRRMGGD